MAFNMHQHNAIKNALNAAGSIADADFGINHAMPKDHNFFCIETARNYLRNALDASAAYQAETVGFVKPPVTLAEPVETKEAAE